MPFTDRLVRKFDLPVTGWRGRSGSRVIEELHISGLGVIDDAVLELDPGLTVVTGETGAGKTMVVAGLGLLLGGRADTAAVRAGASRALVEGRVHLAARRDRTRRRGGGGCRAGRGSAPRGARRLGGGSLARVAGRPDRPGRHARRPRRRAGQRARAVRPAGPALAGTAASGARPVRRRCGRHPVGRLPAGVRTPAGGGRRARADPDGPRPSPSGGGPAARRAAEGVRGRTDRGRGRRPRHRGSDGWRTPTGCDRQPRQRTRPCWGTRSRTTRTRWRSSPQRAEPSSTSVTTTLIWPRSPTGWPRWPR